MNLKYLILTCIAGAVVTFDQLTKLYIITAYRLGESTTVIQNYFDITYVRNVGAAFGFMNEVQQSFREIFFFSVTPLALILILRALKSVSERERSEIVGFSLIFGGAIGNYLDRLRFRYVIDFLDVHIGEKHWPAFNVADSSIVCGVSLLMLIMFMKNKKSTPALAEKASN